MQLINAIGLKLETSLASPFFWIKMVDDVFHISGTSLSTKQRLNIFDRMVHFGSTERRCRYSTLSDPGAELERDLSFLAASSGETGAYKFSSTGEEGTKSFKPRLTSSALQCFSPNTLEKVLASSVDPVYDGELLFRTCLAARFFDKRYSACIFLASRGLYRSGALFLLLMGRAEGRSGRRGPADAFLGCFS
jgi:hypothetical protein